MTKEAAYWISLAHLPRWGYFKINKLIIQFYHDHGISIIDFFHLSADVWRKTYHLDDKQINDLLQAKAELPNNAFLAESLLSQGYEIIPITAPEYPKTLKKNLKVTHAPSVLYIKGNKNILKEKSVAIVGSRNASRHALSFTDNVVKKTSEDFKVIVSGFAKGVDRQALDSAIKYKGQSVIVLPQGIMTFSTGFKNYYKQIVNGDVLVLSTFPPKAKWSVGFAMARNAIIYGLADEIYVAESSESGGTWTGVMDGLKRNRTIFVRSPEISEKNANRIIIQKGAIAVGKYGDKLVKDYSSTTSAVLLFNEPEEEYNSLDGKIRKILSHKTMTTRELLTELDLDWSTQKLNNYLKRLDMIENIKKNKLNTYKLKDSKVTKQPTLF